MTTSIIVTNIISAVVGMFLWERKGGDPIGAFLLGAVLGLLGLLILAVSSPRQKEIDRVARRHVFVRCSGCDEPVRSGARICRYCRCPLTTDNEDIAAVEDAR